MATGMWVDRPHLLTHCGRHVQLLLKYNNFCGVMAFVAAFHSAAISRLKRTWEKVSSSQRKVRRTSKHTTHNTHRTHHRTREKRPRDLVATVQVVDKLTEIFSPSQSFKNYRAAIRSAKRPGCPYV